jgi:hypothetical protein
MIKTFVDAGVLIAAACGLPNIFRNQSEIPSSAVR